MIVKKYTAATETEAAIKAKEDLGPGAVVLNIKTVKQRGLARLFKKDFVEVTAALEEKEVIINNNEKNPQPQAKPFSTDVSTEARQNQINLEKKLDSLHDLLQDQIKKSEDEKQTLDELKEVKAEPKAVTNSANIKYLKLIYNKLIDSEVDEKIANLIIDDIDSSLKKEANIDNIIASVYQKIILKLGEPSVIDCTNSKKIVFFMGPTGVGKTTTIAKLASDFKLNKGKKVAMITADTYRIAAVEQLKTYASILDVPVSVIFSPSEITAAVNEFADFDLIFVDTFGRSHKNVQHHDELVELFSNVENSDVLFDVDKYLVLSATTKYRDLIKITEAYKDIKDYKLLFTKLDETNAFGNLLNIRHLTGASLSYTTCGQNVPDDIEVTDVQGLAKQLISGSKE